MHIHLYICTYARTFFYIHVCIYFFYTDPTCVFFFGYFTLCLTFVYTCTKFQEDLNCIIMSSIKVNVNATHVIVHKIQNMILLNEIISFIFFKNCIQSIAFECLGARFEKYLATRLYNIIKTKWFNIIIYHTTRIYGRTS